MRLEPLPHPFVLAGQQASSADLRFKVRGFSALNARMHIEGKRNAIDAQSAEPFLVLRANPREFPPARPLPVLGVLHQPPAYRVQMNVLDLLVILPHGAQGAVEKAFLPKLSGLSVRRTLMPIIELVFTDFSAVEMVRGYGG